MNKKFGREDGKKTNKAKPCNSGIYLLLNLLMYCFCCCRLDTNKYVYLYRIVCKVGISQESKLDEKTDGLQVEQDLSAG